MEQREKPFAVVTRPLVGNALPGANGGAPRPKGPGETAGGIGGWPAPRSFFGVLWSKVCEWRNVQSKDLDLRDMSREVEVLEARDKLAAAKLKTHETEAEADFLPQIRRLTEERRKRGLEAEIALEIEKVNQSMRKLRGEAPALPSVDTETGAACSDEEVDQVAMKAVVRFGQMEPGEAEDAWREWRDQVRADYETNTAAEILQRAVAYSGLAR